MRLGSWRSKKANAASTKKRGEMTEAERAKIAAWDREHYIASHPGAAPAKIERAMARRKP